MTAKKIPIEADAALQLMSNFQEELFDVLGQIGKVMVNYSDEETVEQVAMGHLCLAYQALMGMKNSLEKVISKAGEETWHGLPVSAIPRSDCSCGCANGCAWERG